MNRHVDPAPDLASNLDATGGSAFDDAGLGRLVRDVADGWTMPPIRLDEPAWRDRVRTRRARNVAAARAWFGRGTRAATAAIALTVSAAIFGVWLTQRPPDVGRPSDPARSATPDSSPGVALSPLPKLLVEGDLPDPSTVVVQLQEGDHAIADLATGTLGAGLTGSGWPSEVRQLPDGSLTCLCVTPAGNVAGSPTRLSVSLVRFDAAGSVVSRTDIGMFEGAPDPREDAGAEHPSHVLVAVTFARDGRHAFVGWSARAHPAWHNGLVVVDLEDGSIVGRYDLPDGSTGDGEARRVVDAPRVVGEAGARVIVGRSTYSWSPASSSQPAYHFGTEAFEGTIDAGLQPGSGATFAPLAAASNCGGVIDLAGGLPEGGTWLACRQGGSTTVVRRIDGGGAYVGDTRIQIGPSEIDGLTSVAAPDGSSLFVWNPLGLRLTRVDLASGETTEGPPAVTGATDVAGPLTALGRWLVPSAAAKMILRSGIVLAPDGSRVYALGIRGGESTEIAGSAGIFAFDAATLAPVWHVQPNADYVSLAVGPDGRFVYAAGMAGFDGSGRQTGQPASITVVDAGDGSTRLVAGQLGRGLILFAASTLP